MYGLKRFDRPIVHLLDRNEIRIGRDGTNDIVVRNLRVKPFQCKIVKEGNHFYIEEPEVNGTFKTGESKWLTIGDKIRLGEKNDDDDDDSVAARSFVFLFVQPTRQPIAVDSSDSSSSSSASDDSTDDEPEDENKKLALAELNVVGNLTSERSDIVQAPASLENVDEMKVPESPVDENKRIALSRIFSGPRKRFDRI